MWCNFKISTLYIIATAYCDKYNEIKMCDLELFSEIRSQIIIVMIIQL